MRRWRWALALTSVVVVLAVGCSDDDSASTDDAGSSVPTSGAGGASTTITTTPPGTELDLTAADFSYDAGGVAEIPAGAVTVNLTNGGEQEHQATITRFKEGKTLADLAAVADDPSQLPTVLDLFGGPNAAAPGETVSATAVLEPGSYTFMCFIPDPADGQPHVAKGQLLSFEVTAPAAPDADVPSTEQSVTLDDFEFELPDGFTGAGAVTISNTGEQPHELAAYRVADGATADEAAAYLATDPSTGATVPPGPPPFEPAGGLAATNPGTLNVAQLDLTAGDYVFVCFLPDAETGAPHFTKGMITTVTIE
jgi:hypothetical protein